MYNRKLGQRTPTSRRLIIPVGAIASAVLVLCLPWVAAAKDCKYNSMEWFVKPSNIFLCGGAGQPECLLGDPGDYDACASAPLLGTIRGTLISCTRIVDDFVPYDTVFEDDPLDPQRFFVSSFKDRFITKKGDEINLDERGIYYSVCDKEFDDPGNYDPEKDICLQISMMQITDGTGKYEGASGVLTVVPKWPNAIADHFLIQGTICTQE